MAARWPCSSTSSGSSQGNTPSQLALAHRVAGPQKPPASDAALVHPQLVVAAAPELGEVLGDCLPNNVKHRPLPRRGEVQRVCGQAGRRAEGLSMIQRLLPTLPQQRLACMGMARQHLTHPSTWPCQSPAACAWPAACPPPARPTPCPAARQPPRRACCWHWCAAAGNRQQATAPRELRALAAGVCTCIQALGAPRLRGGADGTLAAARLHAVC